jgi:hypothetical protein
MVELIKVIGSSGAIAGWVVWKDWPMLWSGLIAAAQLLDATKHVFPFARLHKAASEMTVAFELLCIDAEAELMEILAADQPDPAMIARRKRLAKLGVETEHKHFPDFNVTIPEGMTRRFKPAPEETTERKPTAD